MPIFIKLSENICLQDKLTVTEVDSCPIKILLKKLIKKYNAPSNRTRWTLLAQLPCDTYEYKTAKLKKLTQNKKWINEEMNI